MESKEIRRRNLNLLCGEYETQAAFAGAIGLDSSYTNQLLGGHRNIGDKTARKLEAKLGKPNGWLDQVHEPVENVREMPENVRIIQVPVLTWVQAGPFVESYVGVEPIEYISLPLKNTRRAYCLIVEGDSMVGPPGSDSYPPGSYIVLNPDLEPQNGSRVVAKKKGTDEATFKVFRREGSELWLRPLNPQYQAIPMTSDYVIIGVVIGTWIPQKNGDSA